MNDSYKTFVVVNPHSSNGRTGKVWSALSPMISDRVGPFDHAMTKRPGEGTELTREALARGYEMIVSVGGDGTHNEVVNGFFDGYRAVKPDAVMAIVTSGTGGDLRRTLGLGPGPEAALDVLTGRATRKVDVGRFTYHDHAGTPQLGYFINILSFGMGGMVDHMVNKTTKALGGRASFFIGTLRALAHFRQQRIHLTLDDGPARELAIHNVAIANGRSFGGGMFVAPDADMADGVFDVVSFVDMTTTNFVSLASSIYKGEHLANPKVHMARAVRITATSDDEVLLDVDGEQPGRLPLAVENLPRRVHMKVLEP